MMAWRACRAAAASPRARSPAAEYEESLTKIRRIMEAFAPMILIVDNYDSFVHNVARYFEELGERTRVVRNDEVTRARPRSSQGHRHLARPLHAA